MGTIAMGFMVSNVKETSRYLEGLSARLGKDAPEPLYTLGNAELLEAKKLAVFCSVKCPASLILEAHDLAKALRGGGVGSEHVVVSGFHSPAEKEVLTVLLGAQQPVVVVAARGLEGMRVKREYKGSVRGRAATIRVAVRLRSISGRRRRGRSTGTG